MPITIMLKDEEAANRLGGYPLVKILKFQDELCFYCREPFGPETKGSESRHMTKDHLFPKYKGFRLQGNTVLACYRCNNTKHDRLPTMDEIIRAWTMIYSKIHKNGNYFICEIRRGKPVIRIDPESNVIRMADAVTRRKFLKEVRDRLGVESLSHEQYEAALRAWRNRHAAQR